MSLLSWLFPSQKTSRAPVQPESSGLSRMEPTRPVTSGRNSAVSGKAPADNAQPGLFEVLFSAMNIMQDRITRSRMAGDPPDVLLAPRLAHLALVEFDRADEAIEVGRIAVEQHRAALLAAVGRPLPATES